MLSGGFGGGLGGGGGSPACGVTSCLGCCIGTTCVPPNSQNDFACGLFGSACMPCAAGQTCQAGFCAATDAGSSSVGSMCTADNQCRPPANGFCIPQTVFGQETGWPGGYCSGSCNGSACPSGSACIDVGGGGGTGSNPICLDDCPAPRQGRSTCRAGYVCEVNLNASGSGICIPACTAPGFACWQNSTCNRSTGYCVGGP